LLENPEFVIDFVGWCKYESQPCPFQRCIIPGRKTRWLLDCSQAWAVIRASIEAPPIYPLIRLLGRWMLEQGFVALESIWWFEQLRYSKMALRNHIHERTHTVSMDDFIDNIPFYTLFASLLAAQEPDIFTTPMH
jgi:hypothetical protein